MSKYQWFKAEMVSLGTVKYLPNHLFEPEKKFEIDRNDVELQEFLEMKQMMTMETFEQHVQGLVEEPKRKPDDKVRQ